MNRKSKAYEEGYEDYYLGVPVTQNPYIINTQEYEEWEEGWHVADDEQPEEGMQPKPVKSRSRKKGA